jgi:hypothetical protein
MGMVSRFITGVAGIGIVSAGAFAFDQTTRDDSGAIIQEGDLGVFSFKIGDCINDLGEGSTIEKARGVPCSEPHEAEVYAETFITDSSESRPANFNDNADEYCLAQFPRFVGISYDSSKLDATYLTPSEESWLEGDREITCLIYDPEGPVTGSLQGTQR